MAFRLLGRIQVPSTSLLRQTTRAYATAVPEVVTKPVANVSTSLDASSEAVYLPLTSLLPQQPNTPRPETKVVSLDPTVFSHPIRRDILHLCVIHHLDSLRQGSANTKTRGEVAGSGRKIRRQKGSGMARLGDAGSPMLRSGGVAFGPRPRDFATKLPRKVVQMGMRVALSAKLQDRFLGVVESLRWKGKKTSELTKRLRELSWGNGVLLVSGDWTLPKNLDLASRNIPVVNCIQVEDLTVYDVLKAKRIVLDVKAVDWLEQRLTKLNMAEVEDEFTMPAELEDSTVEFVSAV